MRHLLPCLALLVTWPVGRNLSAQIGQETRDRLAQLYAPRFHFSPAEAFFPTIPFGPAFDGVDNNGDSLDPVDGSDEIAPLDKAKGRIRHATFMDWYRDRLEARLKP